VLNCSQENVENYRLLNEVRRKLEAVEEEKRKLEEEIVEGRKIIRDLEQRLESAKNEIGDVWQRFVAKSGD